jgi:hypothetical protein
MRIRSGFTDCSAKSPVDLTPRANAPAAESLMKWRRVVFMCAPTFLVIPGEVEESLAVNALEIREAK